MKTTQHLAILGGSPTFKKPVNYVQNNLSSWEKTEKIFNDIFQRHYFANNGPLVQKLDHKLADYLNVKHVVSVTNETTALMVLAKALELTGEIIIPAFSFPSSLQGALWAGLTPVFCDVDQETHMITSEKVQELITSNTSSILGVHIWGNACKPEALEELCQQNNISLIFDASHAFGCHYNDQNISELGRAAYFSFNSKHIINGFEGACIATNDSALAEKLKTIRNFHDSEVFTTVSVRFNAKMSEAQAALALIALEGLDDNIKINKHKYITYKKQLSNIPGLSLVTYNDDNNYEHIALIIDQKRCGLSQDYFKAALEAENIQCSKQLLLGIHTSGVNVQNSQIQNTHKLLESLLLLPSGQSITINDIHKICDVIKSIIKSKETIQGIDIGKK